MSDRGPESNEPVLSGEALDREICELASSLQRPHSGRAPADRPTAPETSWRESTGLAIILLTVAVALTVLNLSGRGIFTSRPTQIAGADQGERLDRKLVFAVREIQRYLQTHGRVPPNLQSIGLAEEDGVQLEAVDQTTFKVTVIDGHLRRTFDSRASGLPEVGPAPKLSDKKASGR